MKVNTVTLLGIGGLVLSLYFFMQSQAESKQIVALQEQILQNQNQHKNSSAGEILTTIFGWLGL